MSGSNELLLDTNIILYLLNGDETLFKFINDKNVYISVITEIELLGYKRISVKEKHKIKEFIKDTTVIELTSVIKDLAIAIREKYDIKLGDSIIAATAMHTGFSFITSDKGFNKIDGVDLVYYEAKK